MTAATLDMEPPTRTESDHKVVDLPDQLELFRYEATVAPGEDSKRYELAMLALDDNQWHWLTFSKAQLWRLWVEIGSELGYEPGLPLSSLERR